MRLAALKRKREDRGQPDHRCARSTIFSPGP